jgi:hypothetical protein
MMLSGWGSFFLSAGDASPAERSGIRGDNIICRKERRPRKEKIWLGIPCPDILLRGHDDPGDTSVTMLGAPSRLKKVQIPARWEPLVPGSVMESTSSVCIRVEQLREPRPNAGATKTRQPIRSQLVEVLNEIQHACGANNAPFTVTDVSYIAYVNKEDKLEGIITIQKRARETLEDD